MRRRRPAPQLACAICGNEEDLQEVVGRLVCTPCRTCPHGERWWHTTCLECLRELFTVHHLTGPVIADMRGYAAFGRGLGLGPMQLLVWTWLEESQLSDWESTTSDRWAATSPPARNAPFPYPLLHHLERGRPCTASVDDHPRFNRK